MKRISTLVAALFLSAATFAQAPQGFSYQAVVRDAQNAIVANQQVDVTITILQGADAASATAVFSEKHNTKTNANGLFTLTIGSIDAAKFSAINWAGGNLFLKTESKYGTATTQLLSVPFAMYAVKAGSADVNLSEYAKKAEIPATPDLSGYALKTDIPAAANLEGYAQTADIAANYALKTEIPIVPTKTSDLENDSNFLTAHQDITGKADKSEMTITNGTGTATIQLKTGTSATVLTQHQSLEGYYSKTEVEALLNALKAKIPEMVANEIALSSGEVVDLGLTSGTLWATCNLGATSPEQYGDYYAWGETEPYYSSQYPITWKEGKTGYNWANYTKLSGGSISTLTKYNNVDNKTALEPDDDAATANWGSGWAMPTTEEFQELYNECYWLWTTDYNGTGVEGYIVYKSADKTKDKRRTKSSDHTYSIATDEHIFLPAAGGRYDGSFDGGSSWGCYWSASLCDSGPDYAQRLVFDLGWVDPEYDIDRYHGFSVRPIRRP